MAYKPPKPSKRMRRKVMLPPMPKPPAPKIYSEDELRARAARREAMKGLPPLPTKPKVYRAVPGAGVKHR